MTVKDVLDVTDYKHPNFPTSIRIYHADNLDETWKHESVILDSNLQDSIFYTKIIENYDFSKWYDHDVLKIVPDVYSYENPVLDLYVKHQNNDLRQFYIKHEYYII